MENDVIIPTTLTTIDEQLDWLEKEIRRINEEIRYLNREFGIGQKEPEEGH